ncbi:hypothetical protein AGLY_012378 [Aphis glycines]|uniref:Uncharacterized protein n=1 Tax=Aphis glycines TaxID=307491 RepID=A0A6G0T9X6_APHGL|nr:hypothetical protein AGLY_012378 [Aphis glycines]
MAVTQKLITLNFKKTTEIFDFSENFFFEVSIKKFGCPKKLENLIQVNLKKNQKSLFKFFRNTSKSQKFAIEKFNTKFPINFPSSIYRENSKHHYRKYLNFYEIAYLDCHFLCIFFFINTDEILLVELKYLKLKDIKDNNTTTSKQESASILVVQVFHEYTSNSPSVHPQWLLHTCFNGIKNDVIRYPKLARKGHTVSKNMQRNNQTYTKRKRSDICKKQTDSSQNRAVNNHRHDILPTTQIRVSQPRGLNLEGLEKLNKK